MGAPHCRVFLLFLSAPQLGEKHERQSSWPMASAIWLPSLPYATETVGYFLPKPSQNLHSLDQESCTLLKFTGPATHPEVSTHLLNNFPGKISNLNKGYIVVCRMMFWVQCLQIWSVVTTKNATQQTGSNKTHSGCISTAVPTNYEILASFAV